MDKISVCICTYKRNAGLHKLLQKLIYQNADGFEYEVIIVDNDKNKGAHTVIKSLIDEGSDERLLIYDAEPQQNIALARNRSVSLATGIYIAFIDDDEFPFENWLFELYQALKKSNADAVFGPVIPLYPPQTPEWIIKGGFFKRPEYQDGTAIMTGRTSNALVKKEWMDKYQNPFDELYGLTGGEDSDFFSRIRQEGAHFCWASKAKVYEDIEDDRLNIHYLLLRAFRGGQGYADISLKTKTIPYRTGYCFIRLWAAAFAQMAAVIFLPGGFFRFVWWQRKVMSNLGQASVFLRYRYKQYKKS